MSDKVQTVLKWLYRFLWFVAGGGIGAVGAGVYGATRIYLAPEAFGSAENAGYVATWIAGGGLTTAISAAAAGVLKLIWGKLIRGKAQPYAQFGAAVTAKQTLAMYLANRPQDAEHLTAISESCKQVFMAALDPSPAPVVEAK